MTTNDFVCFCGKNGTFIVRKEAILSLYDPKISKEDGRIEARVMLSTKMCPSITMGMCEEEIEEMEKDSNAVLDYFFNLLGLGYDYDDATSE